MKVIHTNLLKFHKCRMKVKVKMDRKMARCQTKEVNLIVCINQRVNQ